MSSPAPGKSLYAQLGVSADADQPTLDAAYQHLQQLYQSLPDSQHQQAALQYAYQLLSDPLRRKVYGASLLSGHAAALAQLATATHASTNISIQPALTQPQFGALIGVSVPTLKGWKQGRKQRSGAARPLLAIASTNPKAVLAVAGR